MFCTHGAPAGLSKASLQSRCRAQCLSPVQAQAGRPVSLTRNGWRSLCQSRIILLDSRSDPVGPRHVMMRADALGTLSLSCNTTLLLGARTAR